MKQHKSYLALLAMCTALAGGYTIATTQSINAAQALLPQDTDNEDDSQDENNNSKKKIVIDDKQEKSALYRAVQKLLGDIAENPAKYEELENEEDSNDDSDEENASDEGIEPLKKEKDKFSPITLSKLYTAISPFLYNKDAQRNLFGILSKYNKESKIEEINEANKKLKKDGKEIKTPLVDELKKCFPGVDVDDAINLIAEQLYGIEITKK